MKTTASMSTQRISRSSTRGHNHNMLCCEQVLMWVIPNFCEQGETNQELAAMALHSNRPMWYHQMIVTVMALSSNRLVWCPRSLVVAIKWSQWQWAKMWCHPSPLLLRVITVMGDSVTSPMSHCRNESQDAHCSSQSPPSLQSHFVVVVRPPVASRARLMRCLIQPLPRSPYALKITGPLWIIF
jgi:hypothetical protein